MESIDSFALLIQPCLFPLMSTGACWRTTLPMHTRGILACFAAIQWCLFAGCMFIRFREFTVLIM